MLLLTAVFTPWGFFLGGSFHILPYWQGWGWLHSKRSGDYVLFVRMQPRSPTRLGNAYLSGVAYLCTPRGERFRLSLSALMGNHLGRSTEGEAISLHLYNRPALSWNPDPDRRPRLDLRGRWEPPGLVLRDAGSIAEAFLADGRVNLGDWPATRDTIPLTLAEGSSSGFDAACAAGH